MNVKRDHEFENFDQTMDDLLKVSPDQIRAAMDAEKKAKPERKAGRKRAGRNLTTKKESLD